MTKEQNKKFDIIVYGATSFVGQITATCLDDEVNNTLENKSVTFALAGRSQAKLQTVAKKLHHKTTTIVADAHDEGALRNMVKQASVIISTVGPYDLYGSTLVKVCAEEGVHYCDLAGESHWLQDMIDTHGSTAFENGACILNSCGFDSIPSDLSVHVLQNFALQTYGKPCQEITMRVKAMKGAMSGGTAASIMNIVSKAKEDIHLRKSLKSPYQICPSHVGKGQIQALTKQKVITTPFYEKQYTSWTAPFIMSAINTKVVHRSNVLKNYAYLADFKYHEGMFTGKGRKGRIRAYTVSASLAGLMLGASFSKTRTLLEKYVLPKPGEGPTLQQQNTGFYNIMFYGQTATGEQITLQCKGEKDPGYGATAKMLTQSALALLQDLPNNQAGGFWTPASLLGDMLVQRLENHAGMTFQIIL